MKRSLSLILMLCLVLALVGCGSNGSEEVPNDSNVPEQQGEADTTTILVAAAASLQNCVGDEIIPMFEEKYPNVKVEATYDSSGKLQAQIEEGADVDVFMSAAMKQMNALDEKDLMIKDSIIPLLENSIVAIVPKGDKDKYNGFEDILKAEVIAVGDPESVPAGQYAKEAFENLKMWDQVSAKSSLGTNVTEVLNWVAEGSADAGVVYSTDAAINDKVEIIGSAPEGSVSKVIYPVGIVKKTTKENEAKLFTEFLKTDEAIKVFETFGFKANK
nr:molybdate ABC transporter substrate-binding protein [Sedimentibacter sp.]